MLAVRCPEGSQVLPSDLNTYCSSMLVGEMGYASAELVQELRIRMLIHV